MKRGPMPLFSDWPHFWFGIWKLPSSMDAKFPQIPLLEELLDPTWSPEDKDDLLAYLGSCPVSLASSKGSGPCPLCGDELQNLGCFRTDGVWTWPNSLRHFVSRHDVRLPDRMVDHIRENSYRCPRS